MLTGLLLQTEARLREQHEELERARDLLENSQEMQIRVERADRATEEQRKKYKKAKKLMKEAEEREKALALENETLVQQQTEKDLYYNNLLRGLKDRVCHPLMTSSTGTFFCRNTLF